MRGHENLIPMDKRSKDEAREIGRRGGRASGASRRRKADFRKTLNLLLTTEIDSEEWTPLLHALGLESTLEVALNMARIKEGLTGNVKAYEAIARYSGQSDRTDTDQEEQQVRMAAAKARYGQPDEDEEEPDDGFLDALKDAGDWDGWEQDMEEPEGSGQEGDGDETEEGTADI